jgi:hypothetical protein
MPLQGIVPEQQAEGGSVVGLVEAGAGRDTSATGPSRCCSVEGCVMGFGGLIGIGLTGKREAGRIQALGRAVSSLNL